LEEKVMKASKLIIGVALAVAVGCGGGAGHEAPAESEPVRAAVARAERVDVPQRVELSGTVEADRQAAVSSRVMATVTAVHVQAGDRVASGQTLIEIDPQTAQGQEAQARGALAQAQAGLALAERNYERFKVLAASGSASELELDLARMQYEQARGAVEQAGGAVAAAASVARESRVVAPFAGRVSARLVEVGDLAAPGRPLVMVESAVGRRLVLFVPERVKVAGGLAVGSLVPVRLDVLAERGELEGRVVEIAPGADPASHTFRVEVQLPAGDLPSGIAGRGWIPVGERPAVAVPRAALIDRGGLTLVAVRDAGGRARSRAVTIGSALPGERIEVLSGLAGGEDVLLGLSLPPADGAPVEEVGP
jgi:RND family efflux transporter MFP subunit